MTEEIEIIDVETDKDTWIYTFGSQEMFNLSSIFVRLKALSVCIVE